MLDFMERVGANPGRAGHRLSLAAARVVYDAREAVAELFNAPSLLHVVFGSNITEGLNLALHGLLRPGDHVITSSMEHNAVMRPLRALEQRGVRVTVVPCAPDGTLDPAQVAAAIANDTAMIALNHASNVNGTLLPVAAVGQIARDNDLLLLLDTAQTAGVLPIDMQALHVDLLGFTGHKGLLGPTGTGGLIVGERVDVSHLTPLKQGGTGSRSEHEQQPDFLPDCCESGTLNAVGLAGLAAGIRWINAHGLSAIYERETELTRRLLDGLLNIDGVTVYGTHDAKCQVGTVSFNIGGLSCAEAGEWLDEGHNIMSRVGLHCAPAAHRTIGTHPGGTIRFGLGAFTTAAEVDGAIAAVAEISQQLR